MSIRGWRTALSVWMVLIFLFSSSLFSSENTEQILVFDLLNYVVRKCSHVVEYAILMYLWFRSLCNTGTRFYNSLVWGMVFSVAYAATDEWHQSFVPNRDGVWTDVVWDGTGVLLMALALTCTFYRPTDARKRVLLGSGSSESVYNTRDEG
ncbi:MAG: VanZ family protein [bacterium]|nr:VanZ family protein [bacterium]